MLDPKIKEIVMNGTIAQRTYICERDFMYFCLYYFNDFFQYEMADFHWDMHQDINDLESGEIFFLIWMMFRESAKSTLGKMYACWLGVYEKEHYINFDSYEKENAENALMDIAVWFQSNKLLIRDFGQLYFDTDTTRQKKTVRKRIGNFILSNGVKYEAFSTQESVRGRVFEKYRPGVVFLDDFETNKTKRSIAVTKSIIEHMNEMLSGLGPAAKVIVLCNYITESGSVQYFLDKAKGNQRWRVRRVDAEVNGEPTWPEKYATSDLEATVRSIERPKESPIVSLESKKADLGQVVYATEMLNSPEQSGDLVFDRAKVTTAISIAKLNKPVEELAGLKIWEKFNPSHRYAIGSDTGKGVGRDSSASVCIDFTQMPAKVVGSYANNLIAPDIFGHELKRQGDIFGTCLIAPESNNPGGTTIAILKTIYDIDKIWRTRRKSNKQGIAEQISDELGYETNLATKPTYIYEFKRAFEDGHITIYDVGLLDEMFRYGHPDLNEIRPNDEATRHFDKLIATAICFQMRNYAEVSSKNQEIYQQLPYQPKSEYEESIQHTQSIFPQEQHSQEPYQPSEFEQ